MAEYDVLLDLIVAHPGATRDELGKLALNVEGVDPGVVDDRLDDAVERDDAIEAGGRYWIMRAGRFHPDVYDHPESGSWENKTNN
jgi:hypothetical protein